MSDAAISPKALLLHHGLRAKRHFGQNFLADAQLASRIAELCTTPPGGSVIEIGAGLGALTRPLLARASRVVAIERDRDLAPVLRATLALEAEEKRLSIVEADAKASDFLALLAGGPRPHVIAGNLPYQITGPLLEKVTEVAGDIERVVFLVQLEVADRLNASPKADNYGALSVFVQNRFETERAFIVRRGAFYPQPGVDSAVVVLTPRAQAFSPESETFRALVHAAFGQRRKTLRNAWHRVSGLSDAELASAAARANIDLSLRGETLGVAEFSRMAHEVNK